MSIVPVQYVYECNSISYIYNVSVACRYVNNVDTCLRGYRMIMNDIDTHLSSVKNKKYVYLYILYINVEHGGLHPFIMLVTHAD